MMTIEIAREICAEIAEIHGYSLDFPVLENTKINNQFGRVEYKESKVISLSLSPVLLSIEDDEVIIGIIKHELAHAFLIMDGDYEHRHNSRSFKDMCKRLGTQYDTATANLGVDLSANYKYTVYCTECGKPLAYYQRMCKTLKETDCRISKCCNAPLKLVQNH